MKKLVFFVGGLLLVVIIATGCQKNEDVITEKINNNEEESIENESVLKEVEEAETNKVSEEEDNKITEEVQEVSTFGTPDSVVIAFFNQLAKEDRNGALNYVDSDVVNTDSFQKRWTKIADWVYTEFTVESITDASISSTAEWGEGNYKWVDVDMTIVINGKESSGTDTATVKEKDGKWYLVEFPT